MKILILAAMDKELQLIKNILDNPEVLSYENGLLEHGTISAHEVYAAKCGIGKVNAALNASMLIKEFNPDLVINSGVAGGAGIPIGSVLVADRVVYDDVWCGPGTNYGQADGCPLFFTPAPNIIQLAKTIVNEGGIRFGLICTGDKFISTNEEIQFIRTKFPDVQAVDMESAAIAQACHASSTPFNIVRVVSDTPGEGENISQYQNFWQEAPQKTFNVVKMLIENL